MIQRTSEWFEAKAGKVSASRINDLMAKTKSGYSASRQNYMSDLIVERLTGKKTEGFTSYAMTVGTELEPEARSAYEIETFNIVNEIGIIKHPTIEQALCSPDGLIGDDGMIEIKCFQNANHLNTLLTEEIEQKYIYQMQFQLMCSGRKWNDFCAYNPNFPEGMKLFIKRVYPDKILVDNITEEVIKFIDEMNLKFNQLAEKYGIKN